MDLVSYFVPAGSAHSFSLQNFAKMPKFIAISAQDVEEIAKGGGNKEKTIRRRNQAMGHLREYGLTKENPVDVDHLITMAENNEVAPLENLLEHFFAAFTVGENEELPRKNTTDVYRYEHIS